MKKIALVTYQKLPILSLSDQMLKGYLEKTGHKVFPVIWTDFNINWKSFDTIILRSCWDYYYNLHNFIPWLFLLKKLNIQVWNPIEIILWNLNKKYLIDLQNKNINIVPSLLTDNSNLKKNLDNLKLKNWPEIIIKPAIGASAKDVYKFKIENTPEIVRHTELLLQNYPSILIQKFIKEISDGEYSLIFLADKFSHAIKKIPKQESFKSNRMLYEVIKIVDIDNKLLSTAESIIQKINSPLLYARVDLVVSDQKPLLMELELIEPELYLNLFPKKSEIFVSYLRDFI